MSNAEDYHRALLGEPSALVEARSNDTNATGEWAFAGAALLALAGLPVSAPRVHGSFSSPPGPARRGWDDTALLLFLTGRLGALRSTLAQGSHAFANLWLHLLSPDDAASPADPETIVRETLAEADAPRAIDAMCLWALIVLERGQLEQAVAVARRASRMAGVEGIVSRELFANLVLARVRRHSGQAAAAARILKALTTVAPAPFATWINWELAFADSPTHEIDPITHPEPPAEPLWRGFRLERELLREATDPSSTSQHPWMLGETEDVPQQLRGLIVPALDEKGRETAAAVVSATARGRARRFLARGMFQQKDSLKEFSFSLNGRRTCIALSVLALAPRSTLSISDLVQAVYGFTFIPSKHQGTFRSLLYRMREELGDYGTIHREDDICQLLMVDDMIIPDPRCAAGLEELILRLLAVRSEKLKIDEIAAGLGVPRRTVQRALKGLVDVGTCEVRTEGRNAFYKMEDTTFSEPTLTRLRGGRLD